jgi:hypothetical protein
MIARMTAAFLFALQSLSPAFGSSEAESFSYRGLEALIASSGATTLAELLPQLPLSYRQHYLLIYDSASAQADRVDPQWPRVVFFGRDATFMMAIAPRPQSGDAEDDIETIQFEDDAFVFRRLTFKKGKNPLVPPPEKNPAACVGCHGGPSPRPNWASYNIWPGVYGSVSRLDCSTAHKDSHEGEYYRAFMAGNRRHERYAFLPVDAPVPFKCPKGADDEITVMNGASADGPGDFTLRVQRLNDRRVLRMIKNSPKYESFKYAWAAASKCFTRVAADDPVYASAAVEDLFPLGFAEAHDFPSPLAVRDEILATAKADFMARKAAFDRHNVGRGERVPINFLAEDDPIFPSSTEVRFATARVVFAQRMGLSTQFWTTGFVHSTYDDTRPQGTSDVFAFVAQDVGVKTCREAMEKSVAALAEVDRR